MNPRLTPETAAMREMVLAFAGRDLPPAGNGRSTPGSSGGAGASPGSRA